MTALPALPATRYLEDPLFQDLAGTWQSQISCLVPGPALPKVVSPAALFGTGPSRSLWPGSSVNTGPLEPAAQARASSRLCLPQRPAPPRFPAALTLSNPHSQKSSSGFLKPLGNSVEGSWLPSLMQVSWARLLHFCERCLRAPPRGGKRRSLASVVITGS